MTAPGRWAAGVEYLGTNFCGWQSQVGLPSIQGEVERALSAVADHALHVVAAGRTDAGVHAFQQVIHYDSTAPRTPHAWLLGCNSQMPKVISLRWVVPVKTEFHARYAATARSYRYVIHVSRGRAALTHGRCAWLPQPLDASAMHRAAQVLVGEHDFTAFRDSQCQSPTPIRHLRAIRIEQRGEFVTLSITANAFLHHMVRNIAGTLIQVGQGRRSESWVAQVLAARDRTQAGMTADASGLYFVGPEYPPEFAIPPPPIPWFPS